MPYELSRNGDRVEARVTAPDRNALFGDAVKAGLEAIYGSLPPGTALRDEVVPLQAAGRDGATLLASLLEALVRSALAAPGVLLPPRWLSFDADRVTATLPVAAGPQATRRLSVSVLASEGGWPSGAGSARILFEPEAPPQG